MNSYDLMTAAKYPADKNLGQYEFALVFKLSREKSRKTEEVFLVGSRESEGKSKSPQALFLLPAFSFGEAKENADAQSVRTLLEDENNDKA